MQTYYQFYIRYDFDKYKAIREWCESNFPVGHRKLAKRWYGIFDSRFKFRFDIRDRDDALLFKLTWGSDIINDTN